ncbi:hypothetical protein OLS59_10445, partial [Campylobacter jejuni]|nr:hypothetical protein [Campylobacter jejuni]
EILSEYIIEMGYKALDKNIGFDEENNKLNADQVFNDEHNIYLIEQKLEMIMIVQKTRTICKFN